MGSVSLPSQSRTSPALSNPQGPGRDGWKGPTLHFPPQIPHMIPEENTGLVSPHQKHNALLTPLLSGCIPPGYGDAFLHPYPTHARRVPNRTRSDKPQLGSPMGLAGKGPKPQTASAASAHFPRRGRSHHQGENQHLGLDLTSSTSGY